MVVVVEEEEGGGIRAGEWLPEDSFEAATDCADERRKRARA